MNWSRFQFVSLAVIAGIVVTRAFLLWFAIRVNAFKLTQLREVCLSIGFAFFVLLVLRTNRIIDLPWPPFLDIVIVRSEGLHFVGAMLSVIGILIFLLALVSFKNSWRIGIDSGTREQLVTTGVFAYSRNPIFVFLDSYLVGAFLLNGTLIFLLTACVGILGIHFQILREEEFLRRHYGAAYRRYCSRTARYFGIKKMEPVVKVRSQ